MNLTARGRLLALLSVITVVIGGAAVLLLTRTPAPSRRRFLIPQSFSGQVYLIHKSGYHGPDTVRDSVQTVTVPANGIVVTELRMPAGYDDTYFDVTATGARAQLPEQTLGVIENTPKNRNDPRRLIFNPNAGILELPHCKVVFESFYVGTRGFLSSDPHSQVLEVFAQSHPEVCVRI